MVCPSGSPLCIGVSGIDRTVNRWIALDSWEPDHQTHTYRFTVDITVNRHSGTHQTGSQCTPSPAMNITLGWMTVTQSLLYTRHIVRIFQTAWHCKDISIFVSLTSCMIPIRSVIEFDIDWQHGVCPHSTSRSVWQFTFLCSGRRRH